jgi:hypothetical protein
MCQLPCPCYKANHKKQKPNDPKCKGEKKKEKIEDL